MHKANAEVQSFEIVCPKDLVFRYAFRYNSLYSLFSYRNMLLFSRRRQKVESFVFGSIDIAIVSCTSAQAAEDMWKRGGGGGVGCRPKIDTLCVLTGVWPDFVITLLELVTKRQEKVTKSFEFSGIQFCCELNTNHPISTLNQSLSRRKASRKESKQNFRWVRTTVCLPTWMHVFNNS